MQKASKQIIIDRINQMARRFSSTNIRNGQSSYRRGDAEVSFISDRLISGLVYETNSNPYNTKLYAKAGKGFLSICSCPVTLDCKHAYALALEVLDDDYEDDFEDQDETDGDSLAYLQSDETVYANLLTALEKRLNN
jgi:uncharacterized Zn finger protein